MLAYAYLNQRAIFFEVSKILMRRRPIIIGYLEHAHQKPRKHTTNKRGAPNARLSRASTKHSILLVNLPGGYGYETSFHYGRDYYIHHTASTQTRQVGPLKRLILFFDCIIMVVRFLVWLEKDAYLGSRSCGSTDCELMRNRNKNFISLGAILWNWIIILLHWSEQQTSALWSNSFFFALSWMH